ncbi:MAG: hypothetical protein GF398_09380 [Chitinivibrionales bacterium]|nr:hypothetical protein [Chitinivibrionales bacterium]
MHNVISRLGRYPAMIAIVVLARCSENSTIPSLVYTPPVTFSATVNDSALTMEGNRFNPNTAQLRGDTLDMFFCTGDYRPGSLPTGMYMRMHVYPFNLDSFSLLSTRHLLIKFTDHHYLTQSYLINPSDTIDNGDRAELEIMAYNRRRGGEVHLQKLSAGARPLGQSQITPLEIVNGVITGNIE